jgi:hypothetical protein
LKFSIKSTILDSSEKHGTETIYGSFYRNSRHIYSETKFIKGIYEDTLGIFIDSGLEMATLFSDITHTIYLVNPFYDPSAIMNYAKKYSNSTKIINKKGDFIYDFSFPTDSVPAKKIRMIENNKDNSFIIEFTYQRLDEVVQDIISYIILSDTVKLAIPKISDYASMKDGKYIKKPIIADYHFFNSIPLESLFKKSF